ncbi:MAG TPA: cyclase family protein [Blastocatellia bacterium]|nr:cyclase family protein [Blastocatellia bacterium]
MTPPYKALLLAAVFLSACQSQSVKPLQVVSPSLIDEAKVLDLTYSFDDKTIYWPTAKPFTWEKESWGVSTGGYWYTAARYAASEHGGTHLDAPIHFGEGKQSADELPLTKLISPAIVINITDACSKNADYLLSVEDITKWESEHARIPDDSIVLIHTGWGRFWGDKKQYLGTDVAGDVGNLHFPGISKEAARLLTEQRRIDAIGIDTASIDHGPSKDFIAHQILNGANIYALENVANLERLPAKGATVIALPMKIKGGTGGPARIIALLP